MGLPMAGAIIDFTGIYKAAFYASSFFQLIGGLLNMLVFILQLRATNQVIPRPPLEAPKSPLSPTNKDKNGKFIIK